ncbi:Immunoglobulin lambda variable 8-61 [Vulpes lagopus]
MAWTVLLLGLLAYGSGADSPTGVTQEPSLSVSPGGTVTLTCSLSSGSVSTSNYPDWYQQTQGQSPRMLIYNTNNHPSGVPNRFTGSISGNKATLTITGPQPEDEADYYCAVYQGSGSSYTNPQCLR